MSSPTATAIEQLKPEKLQKMRRLVASVAKKAPVANLQALFEKPTTLDDKTFRQVVAMLDGQIQHDRKSKIAAAWVLGRSKLTWDQRRIAAIALGKIVEPGRAGRFTLRSLVPGSVTNSVLEVVAIIAVVTSHLSGTAITWALIMLFCLPGLGTDLETKQRSKVAAAVLEAIGKMHVRESVDVLSGSCLRGNSSEAARAALQEALPCLTFGDYTRTAPTTVPRLISLLDTYVKSVGTDEWNAECAKALVMALAKVGDKRAIPSLRSLSRRLTGFPSLQSFTAQTIEHLEDRDQQEQSRSMLLRASTNDQAPATLLRPTADTIGPSDSALLVRAVLTDDTAD